ncbi:hypothetical protein Tco_0237872 [Tanacetum coccineum]
MMAGSQCNKFRGDKAKVVKCYNGQGEGHMARQCTQPKQPWNAAWYKDKAMLDEAQEAGQILDEEQLAFLADPGIPDGQAVQTIIPNNVVFQTEDLDTYHSDCDDISNAKAILMANISNYGSDVILEENANKEQNNESVTAELERYKERVKTFEQQKLTLKEQVDSLEQNLSKQIKENECLLQTFMVFKNESKEKENKYMENKIDLEKKINELDNIIFKMGQSAQTVHMLTKPRAFYDNIHKQALGYQKPFYLKKSQRIKPTLYDGIVISVKHVVMPMIDDEETLSLEEESRSKMSKKEKDPKAIKQSISHKPIDYEKLNRLSDDFGKHFTPQQELLVEQAFWLRMSNPTSKPSVASPVKIEAPKELPKRKDCVLLNKKTAFCFKEITAFCLKKRLHFASRKYCVLLEEKIAFCFKKILCFASRKDCVLLQEKTAFCSKNSLRFAQRTHCVLLKNSLRFAQRNLAFCSKTHCVLLKEFIAFCSKNSLRFAKVRCVLLKELIAFC